jgi:hypothetical protein
MKYLFLIICVSSAFSQIKGVVVDSLGTPIPYVNIWVDGENIGTTSEEDGTFIINSTNDKMLVFSAVGFETKRTTLSDGDKTILVSKIHELNEVVIDRLKLTKEIEIGEAKKKRSKFLSGGEPWIYAKRFSFEESFVETPFIKTIIFFTDSEKRDAKIKIRLFEFDNSIPTDDLLNEDIVVSVKKGMSKNVIDVSKYKLKIPKNGVVVGLEWLIIDENKFQINISGTDEEKFRSSYAPSLIINYSEEENAFSYRNGAWERAKKYDSKTNDPWNNKILTPAINLIITN